MKERVARIKSMRRSAEDPEAERSREELGERAKERAKEKAKVGGEEKDAIAVGGGSKAKEYSRFGTAKSRWIKAIHTVLRGVRAVNAFRRANVSSSMGESSEEGEGERGPSGGGGAKKERWNVVKKTAVQHAVQNRMAMEFKVADEGKDLPRVGFQFGKSADKKLFDNCLQILRLDHKKRSRPDVIMLLSLLQGNNFFSSLEYEVKLDLARIMGLQSHSEGTNVFTQGDAGSLFYIVMRGEAEVFVSHMGIQFKACDYGIGGSFGERALLTSEPRAATVTCATDCDFLVIAKRDYLRVLREVHEREFVQKIEFLRTVRYFGELPVPILEEVATKFSKKRYGSNEVIVTEGEKRTHLNIIRSGECRVLKAVRLGGPLAPESHCHLETRQLSSRDFFGEDGSALNPVSVVSRSFAEVYCIHVNDMKNCEQPELLKCVLAMKEFADKFAVYNDESYLLEILRKQESWEREKKAVLKEIYANSVRTP